jgi:hypothetical protein
MTSDITKAQACEAEALLFDSWFDPIEDALRARVRGFIEAMIERNSPPLWRARATASDPLGRMPQKLPLMSRVIDTAVAPAG